MTNYEKLVEALRDTDFGDACDYCEHSDMCKDDDCIILQAADAIEKLVTLYEKAEMDATNLTGKLAQAEADIDRLNLEIDKRIATEIELSNQVDALQAEVEILKVSGREAYFEGLAADDNGRQVEKLAKRNAELHAELEKWVSAAEQAWEPKRGEWIVKGANRIDCSVCGHSVCFSFGLIDGSFDLYKYCPECGAKMEVQDD